MFNDILINAGVASALVVVVRAFLKHLTRVQHSCDACRSQHNTVLTNHVEHNTRALERMADAAARQTDVLKELSQRMR